MAKQGLVGVGAVTPPPIGDLANQVLTGQLSAVGPGQPIQVVGPFNIAIYASINTSLTTTAGSSAYSVASGTGLAAGASVNSKNVPPGTTLATLSGTSGVLAFPTVSLMGMGVNGLAQISGLPANYNIAGLLGATVAGPGVPTGTTVSGTTPASNLVTLSNTLTSGNVYQQAFTFALTGNSVTAGTDTAAIFTGAGVTFSATINVERSFDGGATWVVCNSGGGGTLAQYTAGTPVSLSFGEPERGTIYRANCIVYSSGTINYRFSATGAANLSLGLNQLT